MRLLSAPAIRSGRGPWACLEHIGESSESIHLVAAWREAPYFSDAERAALALAEAATRLADRPDAVAYCGRPVGR